MASLPNPTQTTQYDPTIHVAGIRFEKLGKLYHFDFHPVPHLQPQDYVVVETTRGLNLGQVIGFAEREDAERDYKPLLRLATGRDLLLQEQWKQKEVQTIVECRELAKKMRIFGDIKFVGADYNFEGTYLTILYSTEEDADLNDLRRNLENKLNIPTEFRRIGPREVARRMGGQGACGGPRCCSTFLTEFSPITIKMAKMQGIPLNPNEITGMCGRLRCCLIYEYEQYVEARKLLPKRNKVIGTPHGEARVEDVHPLKDGVSVFIEGQRYFVPRDEIVPLEEFRNLQAKAAQGCTKNEGGGCDCGAHRAKSATGDLKAALDLAHQSDEDDFEDDDFGYHTPSTPTRFADDEDEAEEIVDPVLDDIPAQRPNRKKDNRRGQDRRQDRRQNPKPPRAEQSAPPIQATSTDVEESSGDEFTNKPKGNRRQNRRKRGNFKRTPPKE